MGKSKESHKKRDLVITNSVARALDAMSEMFDSRPFTNVDINDIKMRATLDSGAAVSILGRGCREVIEGKNLPIMNQRIKVLSKYGNVHIVMGKAIVPVQYQQQRHEILFYLCATLEQQAYLGVDFFHAFGFAVD